MILPPAEMTPPPFTHPIEVALAANNVLRTLSSAQREKFATEASLADYAKGELLYRENDPAKDGWAIVRGEIKVVKQSRRGPPLTIEIIIPGEICGAHCYSGEGNYLFAARAMEATAAIKFSISLLEEFSRSNGRLLRVLMRDACRRLYHAQHMRSIAGEDVAGRIACALVYLQDKFGDEIPHSRRTLAELAGTTVESAIRATKKLRDAGIVETRRNHMRILSSSRLKAFAHKTGPALSGSSQVRSPKILRPL